MKVVGWVGRCAGVWGGWKVCCILIHVQKWVRVKVRMRVRENVKRACGGVS